MVGSLLSPLRRSLKQNQLYLFTDALHGETFLHRLKGDEEEGPAIAVSGEDLLSTGLRVNLPGLSLKIMSVNLTHAIMPIRKADAAPLPARNTLA